MIGYISGEIKQVFHNSIIVGDKVGYLVNIQGEQLKVGDLVDIFCHTVVRENDISIWGFLSKEDLELFKLVINVSGVGPKIAQTLLSSLGRERVVSSILSDKPEGLKAPGVGAKIAQKIVIELKDKVVQLYHHEDYSHPEQSSSFENSSVYNESLLALQNLGYREQDIKDSIIKHLKNNPESKTQEVIVKVLQDI